MRSFKNTEASMKKNKLPFYLFLAFGLLNHVGASVVLQEEFNSSSQFKIMGSGVSLSGGKVNFKGSGYVEFNSLPNVLIDESEVSLKVRFNSLTDNSRFVYLKDSFFFQKSGKNIILNLIVNGKFESLILKDVIKNVTTEYLIKLKTSPGLAIAYINGAEVARRNLAGDLKLSPNKPYLGGTPWGDHLNGSMDSLAIHDMSEVETEGPDVPAPIDPSVNSPDARFVSASGSDSNNGALSAPFKTLNGAVSKLLPGNILFVRGGVYREEMILNVSGTPEKPIIIKNYPGETAIMNGGLDLKSLGLKKLAVTEPALLGNPNWKNFYKVIVPLNMIPAGHPELVFGNRFMKMAQTSNRPHDVFMKGVDFMPITLGHGSTTYVQHSSLSGKANNYWTGKVLDAKGVVIADYKTEISHWSHLGNNEIFTYPVISSSADKVFVASMKHAVNVNTKNPSGTDGFTLVNHPISLDQAGEFVYYKDASGNAVIYAWPYDSSASDISIITKVSAIKPGMAANIPKGSHIKIDGLQIRNYGVQTNARAGGVIYPAEYPSIGVEVKNITFENLVGTGVSFYNTTNSRISNNIISKIKSARGLTFLNSVNSRMVGNVIDQTERTGIYSAGSTNTLIMLNTVGKQGLHGNGISAYQGDKGTVIYRNRIDTENIPITVQSCSDVTVISNIATTSSIRVFTTWGGCSGSLVVANNIFYSSSQAVSIGAGVNDSFTSMIAVNNITSGGVQFGPNQRMNNIYVRFLWNENASYGWNLGANEVYVPDMAKLFKSMAGNDYRPLASSPSVNKGISVTSYLPHSKFPDVDLNLSFDGIKRGAKPDIGAYELP